MPRLPPPRFWPEWLRDDYFAHGHISFVPEQRSRRRQIWWRSYKHARQVIYDLHNMLPAKDIFTPIGTVDRPAPNAQLSGTTDVAGWAFDDVAVSEVDVYVDGVLAGTATYGGSRPDVANDWPHAPSAIGYNSSLDTISYANGPHTVEVRAIDTSGNVAALPGVPVIIQN
jgi:hypothetical protein